VGVRDGRAFLEGLRDDREVWIGGDRVEDVTRHPGLRRGAESLARLLDRQHDPAHREMLTYASESSDERYAMSFLRPTDHAGIERRGAAFYSWAKWSGGMLGRTPDYLNTSFMAFASAAPLFDECRQGFGENVRRYYRMIRDRDLVLTHTLVNPQVNRQLTAEGNPSEEVALRVVKESDAGLTVRGARLLATLGPLSDEIAVFPSTILKVAPESKPYALAFALPNSTPGMKYLCRDSYDTGKSVFDAPLSSRFEEMDSVVIFDDVLVPWERVFLYNDPLLCNEAYARTSAVVHMMHQVVCKNLAKAEFIVGHLSTRRGTCFQGCIRVSSSSSSSSGRAHSWRLRASATLRGPSPKTSSATSRSPTSLPATGWHCSGSPKTSRRRALEAARNSTNASFLDRPSGWRRPMSSSTTATR
jgi:4-hydroxyphenylacetate 3-monooxygenase